MVLPLDPGTGLLVPGRHASDWDELEAAFVTRAPHSNERRTIYSALRLWAESAWSLFPGAAFWVDGGFVTHKVDAPLDADVVVVAPTSELAAVLTTVGNEDAAWQAAVAQGLDPPKCPTSVRLWGLLTLQDVTSNLGGPAPRIQPFGGLVDGFIVDAGQPAVLAAWDQLWSNVMGDPTARKGYVEVMRQ